VPTPTGVLTARPRKPSYTVVAGLHPLGLNDKRDALLYVPESYEAARPVPLIVNLHGAGGNAERGMRYLRPLADKARYALLAPVSRAETWDVIIGGLGPDAAFIDRALNETFGRCAVDPLRLAIGGFSDGASYALTLGAANGDLFTHVLAFSPGFMAPPRQQGSPAIFMSHGTRDQVLPIDRCSRRLKTQLERAGYKLTYREFDGPHTVPPEIASEAVRWFTR
jgi:phospholipase/carboxylesterase